MLSEYLTVGTSQWVDVGSVRQYLLYISWEFVDLRLQIAGLGAGNQLDQQQDEDGEDHRLAEKHHSAWQEKL